MKQPVRVVVNVIDDKTQKILGHTQIFTVIEGERPVEWSKIFEHSPCDHAARQMVGHIVGYFDHHTRPCDDA